MYNCIILRYGELGLKSERKRSFFERHYVWAIKDGLDRHGIENYEVRNFGKRFVVIHDAISEIIEILKTVPGIQSISPAFMFSFSSKEELLSTLKEQSEHSVEGKTFCVKTKRVGTHDFSSMDIDRELGALIAKQSGGVNLKTPEVAVHVEVREKYAFLYHELIQCLGGLPPKTSGHVLALFSGGIDSPIAAYQMIKRGCQVDFLFINLLEEHATDEVAQIYNYLASRYVYGYTPYFNVIDGKKLVKLIIEKVEDKYRQLALKVVFYKLAEAFGKLKGHDGIITGEALSQKSTQTIESLRFIEAQVNFPFLRPLIGMDKLDIMSIARTIGTLPSSEKVREFCGISQGPVSTAPSASTISKFPDFSSLIEEAIQGAKTYKGLVPIEDAGKQELTDKKEILTVDVRPRNEQEKHPLTTQLKDPYPFVLENLDAYAKGKTYLFICDFGVQSENVAYILRKKGISAAGVTVKNFLTYFKELV